MIRQVINVNGYWKVIVYYNIDYNLFDYIAKELHNKLSLSKDKINNIKHNLYNSAKAVTISSIDDKISVVLFNKHKDKYDYINSIVHEAEHVKQHMLKYYNVDDFGEPPAYTVGYLVMMMMKINLFSC